MSDQLRVGDTVAMLAALLPDQFAAVKGRYSDPDSQAVLTPGGETLGDDGLEPALAATQALLANLDAICVDAVTSVRRKLSSANVVELAGKLISAGSCGTLVVLILKAANLASEADKALALAVTGFLAAAAPMIVTWLRGGTSGKSGALSEQFTTLRDLSFEARRFRGALQPPPVQKKAVLALLNEANLVAKQLWVLLIELRYSPGVARVR